MSFLIDYVGPFLLMLGLLVLVHEVGHFWMAKTFKVKVERFSVGFGPSILRRKIGETEYVFAWFLLGGYVKMLGENADDELSDEERKHSFNGQSPWRRDQCLCVGPRAPCPRRFPEEAPPQAQDQRPARRLSRLAAQWLL